MKLTELNPKFIQHGGDGIYRDGKPCPSEEGVGIILNCPCGCEEELYVPFSNPLDENLGAKYQKGWKRTGDTFETLTLEPSIQRRTACKWHGYIRNGEIITV